MEDQAIYQPKKYSSKFVGIDPGRHTGVAIYEPGPKTLRLFETNFWGLVKWIEAEPVRRGYVYILEDPAQNKSMYARHNIEDLDQKVVGNMGRKVGRNLEQAYLLIEYFKMEGLTYRTIRPKGKKWDQQQFIRITGLKIITSQHKRDAARLVYGL